MGSSTKHHSSLVDRSSRWRRPEWVRFEDKTVIDAFWDRAGIRRQPSVVVPLAEAIAVAHDVGRGDGTVWAADARDGFHGGASATRWVVDDAAARQVESELADRCERVRVMPFLDGIACPIHGLVDDADVAVLRPVETVTLRRGRQLVYAGCSTFWDPPTGLRAEMRDAVRRAGALLRTEIGFRGTFTIDGVACADGFWPTELNPRFGAGINVIARFPAGVHQVELVCSGCATERGTANRSRHDGGPRPVRISTSWATVARWTPSVSKM